MEEDGDAARCDRLYVVHPFAMICTNGQYYLVGCYDGYNNLTHYRIDRITREYLKEVRGMLYETAFAVPTFLSASNGPCRTLWYEPI